MPAIRSPEGSPVKAVRRRHLTPSSTATINKTKIKTAASTGEDAGKGALGAAGGTRSGVAAVQTAEAQHIPRGPYEPALPAVGNSPKGQLSAHPLQPHRRTERVPLCSPGVPRAPLHPSGPRWGALLSAK